MKRTLIQELRTDGVVVLDDFSPFANEARHSALASGFGAWRPNKGDVGSSVYDGMSFYGNHALLLAPLMRALGEPMVPNTMFFRSTNQDTEGAYVHSDREAGEFTAVVYLSHHDDCYGTGFYRNRRTGAERMHSFADMACDQQEFDRLKAEMVRGSPDDWEQTRFVDGAFNRAVIFDAPLFHARVPRHGFGGDAESGRMVWACHFVMLEGIFNG
ncbi:MAG: DUF6445 family protein [Nevskiaceae bacterium]|nr:DUF6445 family protein [Nevskiaceae bacterium]